MEIYRHAIHSRAFFTISRNSNEPRKLKSIMELEYRWQRADPLMPINSSIWFTSIKTDTFFHDCLLRRFYVPAFMTSVGWSRGSMRANFIFIWCDFLRLWCRLSLWGFMKNFPVVFLVRHGGHRFHFSRSISALIRRKKPDCCIFTKNPFHIWSDYVQFICVRIFSPFANLASGKVKAELFSFYKVKYLIKL